LVLGVHYDGAWAEYVKVPWFGLVRVPGRGVVRTRRYHVPNLVRDGDKGIDLALDLVGDAGAIEQALCPSATGPGE
jgi:hypothetical protein